MRHKSYGSPLEWVAEHTLITAAALALTRQTLNLNLDDDEVAQIWAIDSNIELSIPTDPAADQNNAGRLALIMDPSYPTDPASINAATFEDLETFFTHDHIIYNEFVTAVGIQTLKIDDNKVVYFDPVPILVATNIAMMVQSDPSTDVQYRLRLYFTRKKAGKDDLTRILLKRR